jgi:hypothetical protein
MQPDFRALPFFFLNACNACGPYFRQNGQASTKAGTQRHSEDPVTNKIGEQRKGSELFERALCAVLPAAYATMFWALIFLPWEAT